ncbi:MAG: nitrogenase iron protein NifH [Lachnospiraceae bacterium]|nr:nitrogenase iron protein NifH [Lachnospiraceae bacterium]
MRKIAIYGKGGIGKSTTTSNLSMALASMGYKVMQVGCDPKADSTGALCQGKQILSVLDAIRDKGDDVSLEDIVTEGSGGVLCIEAGGPTPGVGCAGRGIITAFEKMEKLGAFEVYKPDIVIYDVLGDVVCGGFALPIRNGYARNVFVVTSGEKMSMYAAGNIALAVDNFKDRGYAEFSGLILNKRNVEDEDNIVAGFADSIDTRVLATIQRSPLVQESEALGKTVVEAFPDSDQAEAYRTLAKIVLEEAADDQ